MRFPWNGLCKALCKNFVVTNVIFIIKIYEFYKQKACVKQYIFWNIFKIHKHAHGSIYRGKYWSFIIIIFNITKKTKHKKQIVYVTNYTVLN